MNRCKRFFSPSGHCPPDTAEIQMDRLFGKDDIGGKARKAKETTGRIFGEEFGKRVFHILHLFVSFFTAQRLSKTGP